MLSVISIISRIESCCDIISNPEKPFSKTISIIIREMIFIVWKYLLFLIRQTWKYIRSMDLKCSFCFSYFQKWIFCSNEMNSSAFELLKVQMWTIKIDKNVKMSNPIIVVEDTSKSLEDTSRSTPIYKPKSSTRYVLSWNKVLCCHHVRYSKYNKKYSREITFIQLQCFEIFKDVYLK